MENDNKTVKEKIEAKIEDVASHIKTDEDVAKELIALTTDNLANFFNNVHENLKEKIATNHDVSGHNPTIDSTGISDMIAKGPTHTVVLGAEDRFHNADLAESLMSNKQLDLFTKEDFPPV
jgi:hypothetical protein